MIKNVDNKYMKYLYIVVISFIISALILCSLSTISAYTITNSTSINTGISNTPGGDTLYLQPGNYSKPNDAGITINRNIVIEGNGSTDTIIIDAQKNQQIFDIGPNNNVRFINLTFMNGRITGATSYGVQFVTIILALLEQ